MNLTTTVTPETMTDLKREICKYLDTFSNEIVTIIENTPEPGYVKIEGNGWSRYTSTNNLIKIK